MTTCRSPWPRPPRYQVGVFCRIRAGGCCEYCLIHEDDAHFPHQPDHIIACKHRGEIEANNIGWACYLCSGSVHEFLDGAMQIGPDMNRELTFRDDEPIERHG